MAQRFITWIFFGVVATTTLAFAIDAYLWNYQGWHCGCSRYEPDPGQLLDIRQL